MWQPICGNPSIAITLWAVIVLVAIVLLVASMRLRRYRLQEVSRYPDSVIVFPLNVEEDDTNWAA